MSILLNRRQLLASLFAVGASLVISANPGCTLQISAELAERGQHIATAHTAEVLDASIRGVPLGGAARS